MYAKVFAQIFDSSIADDFRLRHFFMDLLVLADVNGVVDMTPTAIAARTRIPIDDVAAMLSKLEQPDPESRTAEANGSRIERLDEHRTWGWHIINYKRFREIASEEQRREKTRERVASFRQKRQQKPGGNAPVTPGNAGNAMQKQKQRKKEQTHTAVAFDEFWRLYPKQVCQKDARRAFAKVTQPLTVLLPALQRLKESKNWEKDDWRFFPSAAKWLDGERWNDAVKPTAEKWNGVHATKMLQTAEAAGDAKAVEHWQNELHKHR